MPINEQGFKWPLGPISLLTDCNLHALRTEPKVKLGASREKEKLGHTGKQYELAAVGDPGRRYRLFIRQSLSNANVFSAGLILLLPENDLVLCRYNSSHHAHRNILEKERLAPAFHQHIATQRYITAGLNVDGYALQREDYNSLDTAIATLVRECNIDGIPKTDLKSKLVQI